MARFMMWPAAAFSRFSSCRPKSIRSLQVVAGEMLCTCFNSSGFFMC